MAAVNVLPSDQPARPIKTITVTWDSDARSVVNGTCGIVVGRDGLDVGSGGLVSGTWRDYGGFVAGLARRRRGHRGTAANSRVSPGDSKIIRMGI
jgi:hypothetical protein